MDEKYNNPFNVLGSPNPFLSRFEQLTQLKPRQHYSGDGLIKRNSFDLVHRKGLEEKYGPLPLNYFDLLLSDQSDLIHFKEMILKEQKLGDVDNFLHQIRNYPTGSPMNKRKRLVLMKGANPSTFDFSQTLNPKDIIYQRAILEEKYGLLPSNYFELTPSEQKKFLSRSRLLKRSEARRSEARESSKLIRSKLIKGEQDKIKPKTNTKYQNCRTEEEWEMAVLGHVMTSNPGGKYST
jgi:hypothetical protein